jgi:hypothetical protein
LSGPKLPYYRFLELLDKKVQKKFLEKKFCGNHLYFVKIREAQTEMTLP